MATETHILANHPNSPLLLPSVRAIFIFSGALHLRNTVCSSLRPPATTGEMSSPRGSYLGKEQGTAYPPNAIHFCAIKTTNHSARNPKGEPQTTNHELLIMQNKPNQTQFHPQPTLHRLYLKSIKSPDLSSYP